MTHRERELLRYIESYQVDRDGVSPSFEEMKDALKLASKSGIYRLLDSLERQGLVRRERGHARNIRIVGKPYVPSPIAPRPVRYGDGVLELPLYGRSYWASSSIPSSSPNSLEPSAGIVPGASRGGG